MTAPTVERVAEDGTSWPHTWTPPAAALKGCNHLMRCAACLADQREQEPR